MVLNQAQGLKKKSHEVSARKNNNRLRYNKKCRGGGADPGSFRVNAKVIVICKPRTLNDRGEDTVKYRNRKKYRFLAAAILLFISEIIL